MFYQIDGTTLPWRLEEVNSSGDVLATMGRFSHAGIAIAAFDYAAGHEDFANRRLMLLQRGRVVRKHRC